MEKLYHLNMNLKKEGLVLLMSSKMDFREREIAEKNDIT